MSEPRRFEIRPEWRDSIRAHVDRAPPLTGEQIDKLAVLLRPAPSDEHRTQPKGAA